MRKSLFEVRLVRWHSISPQRQALLQSLKDKCDEPEIVGDQEGKEFQEYYVASHIKKVIEKIEIEFQDQSVEVKMIREIAPVLAILD